MYELFFLFFVFYSVVHMLIDTCVIPDKLIDENVITVEEMVIIH